MSNRSKDNRPRGLRPIQKIELSDTNLKPKFILMIAFLIIGIIAFGVFLWSLLDTDPGFSTVEVAASETNCSGDFIFNYCFGKGDLSPIEEKKQLTSLYTDATVKAYRLFNRYESFDGVKNVHYINEHIGEEIVVDETLYNAFSTMEQYGGRYLYLAPLHAEYSALFFGIDDAASSAELDPYKNEETAKRFAELCAYVKDENAVKLVLLGDNRVRLDVSDEYRKYSEENGIEVYIDFFRAKNAFIIDCFADIMSENGLTNGTISSYDGFVRSLGSEGDQYSVNLFDAMGTYVYNAARLNYKGARAIVSLRGFPMGELDGYDYYVSPTSGAIIPPYVDATDGLYRTATDSLVGYSDSLGCAEMFLRLLPEYIADELDGDALNALAENGLYTVFFDGTTAAYNDKTADISDFYKDESITYTSKYVGE